MKDIPQSPNVVAVYLVRKDGLLAYADTCICLGASHSVISFLTLLDDRQGCAI